MKPPCEIVVSKMLPHIRANIVKLLTQEYGMKQIEVAKLLGITQASVSQYISSTRGEDEEFRKLFPEVADFAKVIAERIASGGDTETQVALMCEICHTIRDGGKFCDYHRGVLHLDSCGICYKDPAEQETRLD